MQTNPTRTSNEIRIGDLLVSAGLVRTEDLCEAMEIASSLGLPVGKVLVMSGFLAQPLLQATVQAQALLRDQLLQHDIALQALAAVKARSIPLADALHALGWSQTATFPETRLGDLLISSGLISKEDLQKALEIGQETGLPLGRVLYASGKITDATLWSALNAQVMIRDKRLTKDQAAHALRSTHDRQMELETLLQEQNILKSKPTRTIKLGELLVLAGFLSQDVLLTALEIGLLEEKPLGQILINRDLITKSVLDKALELQALVEDNKILPVQASEVLRLITSRSITISQAMAMLGYIEPKKHETIRLGELLKLAGLITEGDILEALRISAVNGNLLGKILVATGQLDETLVHAALHCQFMLREGFLREEQAVIALNYCQRMRCGFNDALRELGWVQAISEGPIDSPAS